ncbi:oncoprotein-induced transcript 3 protein-like [Triplophysa rosa]|uniref:oncoprotein-induced transcript 3 protein-like n=1 Tax=Triplophysa rosa TaxID=992332 RepID=UPI0025462DBF|nr:oncoprotein-induced transcript 3 protein-like [Triplophysa rosa]
MGLQVCKMSFTPAPGLKRPKTSFIASGFIVALFTVIFALPDPLSADPCYNYTVLNNAWRATDTSSSPHMCDRDVNWVGWYRLYLNGQNVRMPETCVEQNRCGTQVPLWLSGGHPKLEDGVVTRDVCGHFDFYCCYYHSFPIRVKACPDNYYVYGFVTPIYTHSCSAYCADVKSKNTTNFTSVISSTDPCYNYTVLNDSRRSTSYSSSPSMCDRDVNWVGWYRLYLNGQNVRMPETCVPTYRCGTDVPLWLSDGHPKPEDGVVTRDVCGHWNNHCSYYRLLSIRVKACPDNYYVYEFVTPTLHCSTYCADHVSVDPCYNYIVLYDSRRSSNYSSSTLMCDRDVSWVGWYRLYLNGQNV